MIKTIKVMLCPNNKQKSKLFAMAGARRFAYNWAIDKEKQNYQDNKNFLFDRDVRKLFTQFKTLPENSWLNNISNDVTKQAIKDACQAYKNFFEHRTKFPKYKKRKDLHQSFYQDSVKIEFSNTHVKLEKIANSKKQNKSKLNWIRLSEHDRIPTDTKYCNPRITFDGLNWYVSVGIEMPNCGALPKKEGIGIDLGVKDLAICSNGIKYANINKNQKIKRLEKHKRRLQRLLSKKYKKNKKGEKYCKTSNIIKSERALLKLNRRLTNIRKDYIHKTTTDIIKREPSFICLEDLNVNGMLKNHKLARSVQMQCFREFRRQIEYKTMWNNISLIIADRWFPSSKMCSQCGEINKFLTLKDRTYVCKECGIVLDRDFNASINLKHYAESVL